MILAVFIYCMTSHEWKEAKEIRNMNLCSSQRNLFIHQKVKIHIT